MLRAPESKVLGSGPAQTNHTDAELALLAELGESIVTDGLMSNRICWFPSILASFLERA